MNPSHWGYYANHNQSHSNQTQQQASSQYQSRTHTSAARPVARSASPNTHQDQYTRSQPHQSLHEPVEQPHRTVRSQTWYDTRGTASGVQSAAETLSALGNINTSAISRAAAPGRGLHQAFQSQNSQTPYPSESSRTQSFSTTAGSAAQQPSNLSLSQTARSTVPNYSFASSRTQSSPRSRSVYSTPTHHQLPRVPNLNSTQPSQSTHQQSRQAIQAAYRGFRTASPAQTQASQRLPASAPQTVAQAPKPTTVTYQQPSTVDPSQVYDPWPEYNRKMNSKAAKEAAEAAEKRARAEAEAAARAQLEETRKAAEASNREAEAKRKEEEERRKLEELSAEARRQKAAGGKSTEKETVRRQRAERAESGESGKKSTIDPEASHQAHSTPKNPQEEIKEMMAKLRAMNEQHPELLAQIWEQERRQHLAKSQKTQPPQVSPSNSAAEAAMQTSQKSRSPAALQSSAVVAMRLPTLPPPPGHQSTESPASAIQETQSKWPQEKREQISKSATAWLNSLEKNKKFHISVDTFRRMLDRNPTYIELCEQLEAMGSTLERGAFARALLGSFSQINHTTKQTGVAVPEAMPAPALRAKPTTTGPPAQPNVGRKVVDMSTGAREFRQPSASSIEFAERLYIRPPAKQVERYIEGQWQAEPLTSPQYPPWPGSKSPPSYQMSSSYTSPHGDGFSGVDYEVPEQPSPPLPRPLAAPEQLSEDRISKSPSVPISKASAARKRDIGDIVDLTAPSDDEPPLTKQQMTYGQASLPSHSNYNPHFQRYAMQQPVSQPPTMWPAKATALEEKLRNVELVEQIHRSHALRRSKYNVATIARDVLLATGKHPDLDGLNAHLEVLKTTLSKLGAPGYRIDGYVGVHPSNPDLSTLRWDVLDPGNPVDIKTIDDVGFSEDADNADDESEVHEFQEPARPMVYRSAMTADGHTSVIATGVTIPISRPRTKGVQKKTKTRHSHSGVVLKPTSSNPTTTRPNQSSGPSEQGTRSVGRPRRHALPATEIVATGYTAFKRVQELNANGEVAKRRGRPVGWRKHLHMKTPTGSSSPLAGPSKLRKPQDEKHAPPPQPIKHLVFECKWKYCFAKLHNLETLRKHVHKIHGVPRPGGRIECHWEGCGKAVRILDKTTGKVEDKPQYISFADARLWSNHIEQSHIGPVSWGLGDGPPGGFSDGHDSEVSEAYLSDSRGRQVTPRARVPPNLVGMTTANAEAIMRSAARRANRKEEEDAERRRAAARKRRMEEEDGMDLDE